ncbi:MAG: hypothetical protein A3C11_00725 [Candidatus Sungbacteria bacterium RIFCSPHIGHO2_02_FULL_49_12]|uniref:Magnesium transport protein CorA n=1 Tax=Candidatus Sungbacteria bacterium RIFCSPHIGHO2_02_FULL_49_12 TaxID=1802271 RepID=A0A1G2KP96_9BACT|nr:MAG: hypothetical protein A3C11_00725 [Candidatus Sungbacteria bacterium RIFCSPHIGHO2_02_FULL_49_12]
METIRHKNVCWIDLLSPGEQDIKVLEDEYGIHKIPLHEIAAETTLPKIERFEHELYVVLYFPIFNPQKKTAEGKEIDFIITPNVFVTVHYEPIAPLENIHSSCSTSPDVRDHCFSDTPAHLFFTVLSQLYNYSLRELSHIKKNLDALDNDLFSRDGNAFVKRILETRRDILNFRRTLAPQRHILESLVTRGEEFWGARSGESFDQLLESYNRVWSVLESHKEAIEAIHETNDSLISSKQNDTIQTLTMLSVIVFYLTFIAAIFSTDAIYKPIIGNRYDFWIILGMMGAAIILLLVFFKNKKWL